MKFEVGLARLDCPSCARASYLTVHLLLGSTSVACLHCRELVTVADIEARDPGVGRILGIMRQLAKARLTNSCQGEYVAAGANQPAHRAETQLA